MFHPRPGQLLAVKVRDRYFYTLILTKVALFGSQLAFVFHNKTNSLVSWHEIEAWPFDGFVAFIDLGFAKREGRIQRIANDFEPAGFEAPRRFKHGVSREPQIEPSRWAVVDLSGDELEVHATLPEHLRALPDYIAVGEEIWTRRAEERWRNGDQRYGFR
jgi:hypothetical protein